MEFTITTFLNTINKNINHILSRVCDFFYLICNLCFRLPLSRLSIKTVTL